jgi:signal transduction histidine kinase
MSVDPLRIQFPDLPRSELERAIEELVEKAGHVLATQGRLRHLLSASRAIAEDLDLSLVLRRIAQAAVDLVGATYGALAVLGPDGELEEFVPVGLDVTSVESIGHLPQNHGLLGALRAEHGPVRLEHLSTDPRFSGFPPHHPPMESFVGVPIRVRGEAYGNLYVTDRMAGGSFTTEDEELLMSLASSAGIAIDNARLFGETQRRQRWAIASAEVSATLLDENVQEPLLLISDVVARLTSAATVLVLRQTAANALVVEAAWGERAAVYAGRVVPREATASGRVIDSGTPVLAHGLNLTVWNDEDLARGPAMVLPLSGARGPYGVLAVIRPAAARRFEESDLDMAGDFASHASVALELRDARRARERITLLEDRSRIARDLHDNVIQRLFAAGLSLHSLDLESMPPQVGGRVQSVNGMLDEAITEIRKSVFALSTDESGATARHRLLDVVGEAAGAFPVPPRIVFEGSVDEWAPPALVDDLEAVVREGLSNAARHAQASDVAVSVCADAKEVLVTVSDDGQGPGESDRASGTANLQARARGWGGASILRHGSDRGAVLEWRVPTPPRKAAS